MDAENAERQETFSMIKLYSYQEDAIKRLRSGSILCGGVGSGKSLTALTWFCEQQKEHFYIPAKDLYVITTARKRDTFEWHSELAKVQLSTSLELNQYRNKVVIDSWNNITKYVNVVGAYFIFDEQRVVGSGKWVKSFLQIAKKNRWILLSATPGDTWMDYIPVFIANGFYKNRTEFLRRHVVFSRFSKFPKVERYLEERRLQMIKEELLIDMDYESKTEHMDIDLFVGFNKELYLDTVRNRWNPYELKPIENASEFCGVLRKIVNIDESRLDEIKKVLMSHPKAIIFYNFDYELEILRTLSKDDFEVAEWNGHKHMPVPKSSNWVYLVQYAAGAEGWNCIETNVIIFYSQTYSYKQLTQAAGRIDRLNTPFKTLYYYHLISTAHIDRGIRLTLNEKRDFNEREFESLMAH